MFEDKDLKILLGNSIEEPEVDYDDADVKSELGYPVEEEALKEYFYVTIIDAIGKQDFKEQYLSVYSDMMRYPTKQRQVLAESILKQIKLDYDFRLSVTADTNNEEEINDVLKFIEFIEYDHKDFIIDVWSFLNIDLNSFFVSKYCEQNDHKIILEIEEQISSRDFNWMITNFLRTYNKENMIIWFCNKSKRLKSAIYLKLIEGEKNA